MVHNWRSYNPQYNSLLFGPLCIWIYQLLETVCSWWGWMKQKHRRGYWSTGGHWRRSWQDRRCTCGYRVSMGCCKWRSWTRHRWQRPLCTSLAVNRGCPSSNHEVQRNSQLQLTSWLSSTSSSSAAATAAAKKTTTITTPTTNNDDEILYTTNQFTLHYIKMFRFVLLRALGSVCLGLSLVHILTALHGMQTRSSDENYSVRLSVRLSVKRVDCDKTKEKCVQIFIP